VKRGCRIAVYNYLQTLVLDYLKFFLVSVGTVEANFHSIAQDRTNACFVKQEFIV
jgi:hypothetical protein